MLHSHARHAMRHTHRFLGNVYRTAIKTAKYVDKGFDIFGRTLSTLQPLLDDVAPSTRRALSQGLEDYGSVRSEVIWAHATGQGYVGAPRKNVPELNMR